MSMEKFVTSLEISKRLKELNCRQESEFYWQVGRFIKDDINLDEGEDIYLVTKQEKESNEGDLHLHFYSAFTVGELLEMLPNFIEWEVKFEGKHSADFCIMKLEGKWDISYGDGCCFADENLAEALGRTLIFIKERENEIKAV